MKIRINTIDLHGWKHEEVESKLLSDVIMRVNEEISRGNTHSSRL